MTKTTPYYSADQDITCDEDFTTEKEQALFTRFYAGGDDALEARDAIIKQFLKLVLQLSLRCSRGRMTHDEAISAGNLALVEVLESRRFDLTRGTRFSTFLGYYIRGRVAREARDFPKIEQKGNKFETQEVSDAHSTKDNNRRDDDAVVDETAAEALVLFGMKDLLEPALKRLTKRERHLIEQFYFKGESLWEAARRMPKSIGKPVSRQMASKIHASAMRKLRYALPERENPFK